MIFGPLAGRIINFYPRSPRGERRLAARNSNNGTTFLSTLPARGATGYLTAGHKLVQFLSTLPARGATWPDKAST